MQVEGLDWRWYQRDASRPMTEAYQLIVDTYLPTLLAAGTPVEFIYCPNSDTNNIALPSLIVDVHWGIVLKDAGFELKEIPLQDAMAQADLKEALLAGSNMSTKWH